ncbi:hypothetical protein [Saccharopolyspora gregorii]
MILAGEKLRTGEDTIARIASSLGYHSEHAFNAASSGRWGSRRALRPRARPDRNSERAADG